MGVQPDNHRGRLPQFEVKDAVAEKLMKSGRLGVGLESYSQSTTLVNARSRKGGSFMQESRSSSCSL